MIWKNSVSERFNNSIYTQGIKTRFISQFKVLLIHDYETLNHKLILRPWFRKSKACETKILPCNLHGSKI